MILNYKDIYKLELGEIYHDFGDNRTTVLRVPGGWIFTYHMIKSSPSSVFIPFDNEFQTV